MSQNELTAKIRELRELRRMADEIAAEEGRQLYQVFCRSQRRGRPWTEYSAKYSTLQEAEAAKERAEKGMTLDLWGNLIIYKVKEVL